MNAAWWRLNAVDYTGVQLGKPFQLLSFCFIKRTHIAAQYGRTAFVYHLVTKWNDALYYFKLIRKMIWWRLITPGHMPAQLPSGKWTGRKAYNDINTREFKKE